MSNSDARTNIARNIALELAGESWRQFNENFTLTGKTYSAVVPSNTPSQGVAVVTVTGDVSWRAELAPPRVGKLVGFEEFVQILAKHLGAESGPVGLEPDEVFVEFDPRTRSARIGTPSLKAVIAQSRQ